MNVEKELLKLAEAQEECVRIMRNSNSLGDIRAGFLKVADIMGKFPGQETLTNSLRGAAQQGTLDDDQLMTLRDTIISKFTQQSSTLRKSIKTPAKKWWQFWK